MWRRAASQLAVRRQHQRRSCAAELVAAHHVDVHEARSAKRRSCNEAVPTVVQISKLATALGRMTEGDRVKAVGEAAVGLERRDVLSCVAGQQQQQRSTPVQQFFSGRCVLVTGATGFLGKVLVEKLLRSCPDISTVYALVRPKKGHAVHQRIEDILGAQVFCYLGEQQRRRLVAVPGDISQPGLGLSPGDRAMLRQRVSVIFHVAATVRFDEELKNATAINVRGTHDVLQLAREMPNLKAVVHTSTAYSQCLRRRVEERVYEAPMSAAELMALCDGQADGDLSRVLGSYPNTYSFTKAVTEQLIQQEFSDLPVVIFRPSMVIATSAEPFPGWVDTFHGPMIVAASGCSGHLRVILCDPTAVGDYVPCDLAVNCVIAAAWDVATNSEARGSGPPVYNFVSSCDAPLTHGEYIRLVGRYSDEWPTVKAVWYYTLWPTRSRPLYLLCKLLLHSLPAHVLDTALALTNGKPVFKRIYRNLHQFIDLVNFFITREWDFENKQTKALWSRLSRDDQLLLPFDLQRFDWNQYFSHYLRGVRCFLLKDSLDTLPAAKARWRRLMWLHRSVQVMMLMLLLSVMLTVITMVVFGLPLHGAPPDSDHEPEQQ